MIHEPATPTLPGLHLLPALLLLAWLTALALALHHWHTRCRCGGCYDCHH